MNDLPVIEYRAMRKELWNRQGANIQLLVAGRNSWRKAVSTSQKRDFEGRSTLFRRSFIADGLRECSKAEM